MHFIQIYYLAKFREIINFTVHLQMKIPQKFVKLLDLARVFAALIFLPRDSIGKFFPWAEFSNA